MRGTDAADPRLVLEIALVRLTRREVGPPIQTVIERIERLEQTVAVAAPAAAPPTRPDPAAAPRHRAARSPRSARCASAGPRSPRSCSADAEPERSRRGIRRRRRAAAERADRTEPAAERDGGRSAGARPSTLDDVILAWATVLPELSVATRSAVQEAQPLSVDGDVVTFGVSPRAASKRRRPDSGARPTRSATRSSGTLGTSRGSTSFPHDGFSGERAARPRRLSRPRRRAGRQRRRHRRARRGRDPAESRVGELTANMRTESLGATVVEERHHE